MDKRIKTETLVALENDLERLIKKRTSMLSSDTANHDERVIKLNRIIRDTVDCIKQIQCLEVDKEDEKLNIVDMHLKSGKVEDSIKELQVKLESAIDLGIFLNSSGHRGVGKSTALVNLAREENYTILCKTNYQKKIYEELGYGEVILSTNIQGFDRGLKFVIDEHFTEEEIIELRKQVNIVTGFIMK